MSEQGWLAFLDAEGVDDWVRTADEILAKAVRKRPATSESGH